MNLVEISKQEIVCDSSVVAKKFGMKHSELTKTITKLIADIGELRGGVAPPKSWKEDRHYRGTDYVAYIMSQQFFSLLAMRLKGDKALEWQIKFNDAFYQMERALLKSDENGKNSEWVKVRAQSKQIRLQQTDVIKEFVDYATSQGSKNAKHYYKHYTNATYKALKLIQFKKPKLKDTLDMMELAQLMVAENIAKQSIRKHIKDGEPYKAVYELVKRDLEVFAGTLFITTN
jgi:Rha family phage regulatory protein